jgi:alkylation response protein AidB-like acyl-CoA dehydrogenase
MQALSEVEESMVRLVAEWVDEAVRPVVRDYEPQSAYPEPLIEAMKEMGVFGLAIPEPYGEVEVSVRCYARVTAELARGWMSLAGAMGGHSVVAKLLLHHGTQEQRDRFLPRMATGEIRATMALTEPGGGSDLQAMRTVARRVDGGYLVNGTKTWISNAKHSGVLALLCKTDPDAEPAHKGISVLLVERDHGYEVSDGIPKLGYRGVESCEVSFDDVLVPEDALLGGVEGDGFAQMMQGLEFGRVQVAARAVGVATAAFEDALRYSQEREAFDRPIWKHQSIGNYLADMATKVRCSQLITDHAAERLDEGRRADLEAGMAKLYASEIGMEVALDAMRIHGGYGYSTEFDIERYFRDAPLMIIGEGTNEIQRNVIVRQLVSRGGLDAV